MERSHLFFFAPLLKGFSRLGKLAFGGLWVQTATNLEETGKHRNFSPCLFPVTLFLSLFWQFLHESCPLIKLEQGLVCSHNLQVVNTRARERSIWPPALCQHMPESLQWHQGSREEEWATSWDSSAALAMLPTSPKVSLIDSTNTVGDVSHWNLGWFRWFKPVESLQQEMLFAEYTSGLLHGKQLLSSGSSP